MCQKSWIGHVKACGVVFEGAANKSRKVSGLQPRISAKIPTAAYVHRLAHCLNLALMHYCRKIFTILNEVVTVITASTKRSYVYTSLDP